MEYSLDMLRIDFVLKKSDMQHLYNKYSLDIRVEHWETLKFKSYKHNFIFKCDKNNSFWIGCEPNWNMKNDGEVLATLEFNPNKVGDDLYFMSVYSSYMLLSRSIVCRRFDLAVDIPVTRADCVLIKDRRMYEEYRKSDSDLTQYLGQRNSHGRVKLYNKALELCLDHNELTRLEITIDYNERSNISTVFPKVFIGVKSDLKVSGTDKALIYGALLDINILNFLDKRKKKKIKDILADESLILKFDISKYLTVLKEIDSYINKDLFIKNFS